MAKGKLEGHLTVDSTALDRWVKEVNEEVRQIEKRMARLKALLRDRPEVSFAIGNAQRVNR